MSGGRCQGSRLPIDDCRLTIKSFDFRRMCRLINAFGNVWKGILQKKMLENDVRSGNVYENKGNADKLPGKNSDIFV